jgi:hypothetical protein
MMTPRTRQECGEGPRFASGTVESFDPCEQRGWIVSDTLERLAFDQCTVRESRAGLLTGDHVVAKICNGLVLEVRRSSVW